MISDNEANECFSDSQSPFPRSHPDRAADCLTMELCAGSASLSASLKQLGFQALAYDHSKNRHHCKHSVLNVDLSDPDTFMMLSDIIANHAVVYVHFAPPCGTASRARHRPISYKLKQKGVPEPKPLRSEEEPAGLSTLYGDDLARVLSANRIYDMVVRVADLCSKLKVFCSIENPRSSYFWLYPGMPDLLRNGFQDVDFHGCMHGGERARWCRWRVNSSFLSSLAIQCDNSHPHAPWKMQKVDGVWQFPTAAEAAYPKVLADRVALLLVRGLGVNLPFNSELADADNSAALQAAQSGKQPRGNKLPPLVSEFKVVEQFCKDNLPVNSRVLREIPRGSQQAPLEDVFIAGTYRDPGEFIEAAMEAGHPTEFLSTVNCVHKEVIDFIAVAGPSQVSRHRINCIRWLIQRVKELESEEKALHSSLHVSVEAIIQTKRLLIFRELMHITAYSDADLLFEDIKDGFSLTGKTATSGNLTKRLKPASLSESELRKQALWNRKAVVGSCKPGDPQQDKTVWEESMEEVSKGWLSGPYTEDEVSKCLETCDWLCIKRFALIQKDKTRVIDDCKGPSLNLALTTTEKLDLMSVDCFVNLSGVYQHAITHSSNPEWKALSADDRMFVGRTLDLKSAYKQLPCHPQSLWTSVLVVWNPVLCSHSFFISRALMFGSTASVYAFNRCARAIWHISCRWLKLVVTQFYDDFPSLDIKALSLTAYASFTALLKALGWLVSTTKDKPFNDVFQMLGVQMELSNLLKGTLVVSNLESRLTELKQALSRITAERSVTSSDAASLFGRMGFSLSSCFGRASAPGLRLLSKLAHGNSNHRLSPDELKSFELLLEFLVQVKPRVIDFSINDPPIIVFTDAAYEQGKATYGVFCIEPSGRWVAAGDVPDVLVDLWRSNGSEQIIAQAELYPIILLRFMVGSAWTHKKIVYYIDNDAARYGLIKADSDNEHSAELIRMFYKCELEAPTLPWFARVPSQSNVADLPSRGELFECADKYLASIKFLHEAEDDLLSAMNLYS